MTRNIFFGFGGGGRGITLGGKRHGGRGEIDLELIHDVSVSVVLYASLHNMT